MMTTSEKAEKSVLCYSGALWWHLIVPWCRACWNWKECVAVECKIQLCQRKVRFHDFEPSLGFAWDKNSLLNWNGGWLWWFHVWCQGHQCRIWIVIFQTIRSKLNQWGQWLKKNSSTRDVTSLQYSSAFFFLGSRTQCFKSDYNLGHGILGFRFSRVHSFFLNLRTNTTFNEFSSRCCGLL